MVGQFGLGELPGGALEGKRIRSPWHRQHDVECFPPRGRLVDEGSAETPLLDQVVQRLLAFATDAAIVLERQPPRLADVAQMRGDCRHAAAATSHLDHDLGCPPKNRRLDALTDRSSALAQATREAG